MIFYKVISIESREFPPVTRIKSVLNQIVKHKMAHYHAVEAYRNNNFSSDYCRIVILNQSPSREINFYWEQAASISGK